MRIRKHFAGLSSSDLVLNRSLGVQHRLKSLPNGITPTNPSSDQPPKLHSDQINMVTGTRSWVHPSSVVEENMKEKEVADEEVRDGTWGEQEKNCDDIIRKASIVVEQVGMKILQPSSSADGEVEPWNEADKVVPLKKRKESFNGSLNNGRTDTKMYTTMTKKCDQETSDSQGGKSGKAGDGKKSRIGNVIMEGSRCSRVNGRGWRCHQPTLMGYSLCEHHLGKGRLRSTASARHHNVPKKRVGATKEDESQRVSDVNGEVETMSLLDCIDVETKKVMVTKKRTKIGVVKARSMSSLLGQSYGANALLR